MSVQRKIAFLGAGNMAGAILRGLLQTGSAQPGDVLATARRRTRLDALEQEHGIRTSLDNEEATRWADVVVLATKPQALGIVLPEVRAGLTGGQLVVSVAAGVSTSTLEAALPPGTRVVRAMPNTPALVDSGATAITAGAHASDEDLELARGLFESVGRVVVLEEGQLDAVTGLSGSGPAYLFLVLDALCDAGVKVGLRREEARILAAQTMLGSARLVLETGEHPGLLKDMVTSPGGTAIAGLHTLEAGGLRTTLIDAVEAATLRAQELGRQMADELGSEDA